MSDLFVADKEACYDELSSDQRWQVAFLPHDVELESAKVTISIEGPLSGDTQWAERARALVGRVEQVKGLSDDRRNIHVTARLDQREGPSQDTLTLNSLASGGLFVRAGSNIEGTRVVDPAMYPHSEVEKKLEPGKPRSYMHGVELKVKLRDGDPDNPSYLVINHTPNNTLRAVEIPSVEAPSKWPGSISVGIVSLDNTVTKAPPLMIKESLDAYGNLVTLGRKHHTAFSQLPAISGDHVRLEACQQGERHYIKVIDQDSTNGTFVSDEHGEYAIAGERVRKAAPFREVRLNEGTVYLPATLDETTRRVATYLVIKFGKTVKS